MGTDRSGSPRKMLHSLAILLLSAALTQAKFCPRENNGDECRANSTMYKCGVFFKDLTPKLPLTTKAEQTMGDYLCGQVKRWLKRDKDFKANGRANIDIEFAFSMCGGPWTTVESDGEALKPKEPLC